LKLKGNIIRIPTYYELKFKKERWSYGFR
jgi:hypothetical protein